MDRFYKGNVLLGIIKLIGGLFFVVFTIVALLIMLSGSSLGLAIQTAGLIYLLWYVLDWFLVPLGIVKDNARKLAQTNM